MSKVLIILKSNELSEDELIEFANNLTVNWESMLKEIYSKRVTAFGYNGKEIKLNIEIR